MLKRGPIDARVWLVLAVVATLALPAVAVGVPSAAAPPTDTPNQPGAVGQAGATCDYARLYEAAVGSVVQVSRADAEGSGFVYRAAGGSDASFVLTNQHVVGDAETVTVRFRDGEYGTGTVVGGDAFADLAVVRVDGTPGYAGALSIAESVPSPGSGVAAIGSPFGLEGTVTHGIVSGVNRSMPTDRGFAVPDVVQTDAPINPGNSGGPLLACDGTVVGVNTAGVQAATGDNVGFAISPPLIRRVAPALIENGSVAWPYLGIRSADVTPAVAEANGLEAARGVVVVETLGDGPAAGALRPSEEIRTVDGEPVPVGGDVIVAVEGQRVDTGEDLSSFLARGAAPGDVVRIAVLRDGGRQTVNVTLGERPPAGSAIGG